MNIATTKQGIEIREPIRCKINIMNKIAFNPHGNTSFGFQTSLKVKGDVGGVGWVQNRFKDVQNSTLNSRNPRRAN